MRLTPAWTTEMQSLAENPDVQAVADATDIPGTLGTIAALIRDHDGSDPGMFDRALTGASRILYALIDAATMDDDQSDDEDDEIAARAEAAVQAVRAMYANAVNPKDLGKRRGKSLELLVYRRIARIEDTYATDDCQMDCYVLGENAHYDNLSGREFDVCAWSEEQIMGEAYECAVKPKGLAHRDCQALVTLSMAVQEEYAEADPEPWFRLGLVSFDHSKYMATRMRKLVKTQEEQAQFAQIKVYGWDNLDDITQ